jgi:hypothetical protein
MSDMISIPLNKLVRSPRNVRKTGGESVERSRDHQANRKVRVKLKSWTFPDLARLSDCKRPLKSEGMRPRTAFSICTARLAGASLTLLFRCSLRTALSQIHQSLRRFSGEILRRAPTRRYAPLTDEQPR